MGSAKVPVGPSIWRLVVRLPNRLCPVRVAVSSISNWKKDDGVIESSESATADTGKRIKRQSKPKVAYFNVDLPLIRIVRHALDPTANPSRPRSRYGSIHTVLGSSRLPQGTVHTVAHRPLPQRRRRLLESRRRAAPAAPDGVAGSRADY